MAIELNPIQNDFDVFYTPQVSSLIWEGEWNSNRAYLRNNAVFYLGSSYRANKTTSQQPSINATDWELIARGGSDGGGSGSDDFQIAFAYTDVGSRVIYTAASNELISTVTVIITEAFNGSVSSISLGDSINSTRLANSSLIYLEEVGEYEVNPSYKYTTSTDIVLTLNVGTGVTQGSGYIILQTN